MTTDPTVKRYEVEVPTRNGGGVTTTVKLTDADARRRGLLADEPAEGDAKQKKRSAPKPAGRARAQAADATPAGDD